MYPSTNHRCTPAPPQEKTFWSFFKIHPPPPIPLSFLGGWCGQITPYFWCHRKHLSLSLVHWRTAFLIVWFLLPLRDHSKLTLSNLQPVAWSLFVVCPQSFAVLKRCWLINKKKKKCQSLQRSNFYKKNDVTEFFDEVFSVVNASSGHGDAWSMIFVPLSFTEQVTHLELDISYVRLPHLETGPHSWGELGHFKEASYLGYGIPELWFSFINRWQKFASKILNIIPFYLAVLQTETTERQRQARTHART